jgi:hypothetical protein
MPLEGEMRIGVYRADRPEEQGEQSGGFPRISPRARPPYRRRVSSYLVELYQPRSRADQLTQASARLRAAAAELSSEGTPVRYLRGLFLPEDETCLHLFEADSREAVDEASRRAELAYDRIVEAV